MLSQWIVTFITTLSVGSGAQLPGEDKDFSCIEKGQAEQLLSQFNVNVSSFGGLELCDAGVDTKKLLNDLIMVRDGSFEGSERNLFIRNFVDSRNYFSWLKDMTRGIRRGHDIPYATAYNRGGYFTMQDGWAKLSTLGRVGTLIHEARHTAGYFHVWCDQGPYQGGGVSGCDESLPEGGSHGVEMEYYSRVVLQGKNFHPVYRQMAKLMNLGRANFVFNDKPLTPKSALVGLRGDELLILENEGSRSLPLAMENTDGYALKKTSVGAVMYSGQSAVGLDLYEESPSAVVDEFSYFKLLLDGRLQNVVDMEELDVGVRRYLVALTRQGNLHTYQFSNGKWSDAVSVGNTAALVATAPNGQEGLFLLFEDGSLKPVNPQTLEIGSSLPTRWPENAVSFVNWNRQILVLNQQGQVIDAATNRPFNGFDGQSLNQLISAPIYEAF